ncbi:hypothetical protein [Deinococcus ruber]|nr:hypothetical protein [Deinococcus ruber]
MSQHKLELWMYKHHALLEAASVAVTPDDLYQELITQVQRDYLRLTDVETLAMFDLACTGTAEQQRLAHDALIRNALPHVLEAAVDASPRFGGVLEAYDGALHLVNRMLPRQTETRGGQLRQTGWNPLRNGLRWQSWVLYKLPTELPMAAQRLVDEPRASGAAAAIAAGRHRLLFTLGNDAALHLDSWPAWVGPSPFKRRWTALLPKGRKNILVKREKGKQRFTQTRIAQCGAPFFRGQRLSPDVQTLEFASSRLPLSADWVARAVRANARTLLSRPNLSERTQRDAQHLATVTEEWVNRNAKAHRLDAPVHDGEDARLADIITNPEPQDTRFEAPLHPIDKGRALAAYRRYGPVHGEALTLLPVRELLPIHRKRQQERRVRQAFEAFLTRAGLPILGHQVIAAGRAALMLCGISLDAPMAEIHLGLRGLQDALRGRRSTVPSILGTQLASALHGTPLAPVCADDVQHAQALKAQFPTLPLRFPLAVAVGFGRKLDRQGKADQVFVAACRKAGVRIRVAEDALNRLHDVPLTSRKGERVRVQAAKGYVRPLQLALEAEALRIGQQADHARPYVQVVAQELAEQDRLTAAALDGDHWMDALDQLNAARTRAAHAERISDTLNASAEALETSCADLKLAPALLALLDADDALSDLHALQNPDAWWADAYWTLPQLTLFA